MSLTPKQEFGVRYGQLVGCSIICLCLIALIAIYVLATRRLGKNRNTRILDFIVGAGFPWLGLLVIFQTEELLGRVFLVSSIANCFPGYICGIVTIVFSGVILIVKQRRVLGATLIGVPLLMYGIFGLIAAGIAGAH